MNYLIIYIILYYIILDYLCIYIVTCTVYRPDESLKFFFEAFDHFIIVDIMWIIILYNRS